MKTSRLLLLLVLAFVVLPAHADPPNPTTATVTYQYPLVGSDGFVTAPAAATNVLSTATMPNDFEARWDTRATRWIRVYNFDTAINVCASLGATLGSSLTCDPTTFPSTTTGIIPPGQSALFLLGGADAIGSLSALPELWVSPASGSPRVFVDFFK